jgi:transcriptional antiterminator RfaH
MSEQQLVAPARFDPVMPNDVAWFCLRSQQKHEKIAAGHLAQIEDVEVFNPRIRFRRSTKHGPVWVTESLFPNYLFARFDWRTSLARVHYAPGVKQIVHFGTKWPTVPDEVIEDLRASLGNEELHVIDTDFQPGDAVQFSGGPLHGLKAVVTQVMPGRERIAVLMNFLGQQSMIEVSVNCVVRENTRA